MGADIGIKQAIKNAKASGIGIVAVKNSGHYGLSSLFNLSDSIRYFKL